MKESGPVGRHAPDTPPRSANALYRIYSSSFDNFVMNGFITVTSLFSCNQNYPTLKCNMFMYYRIICYLHEYHL